MHVEDKNTETYTIQIRGTGENCIILWLPELKNIVRNYFLLIMSCCLMEAISLSLPYR